MLTLRRRSYLRAPLISTTSVRSTAGVLVGAKLKASIAHSNYPGGTRGLPAHLRFSRKSSSTLCPGEPGVSKVGRWRRPAIGLVSTARVIPSSHITNHVRSPPAPHHLCRNGRKLRGAGDRWQNMLARSICPFHLRQQSRNPDRIFVIIRCLVQNEAQVRHAPREVDTRACEPFVNVLPVPTLLKGRVLPDIHRSSDVGLKAEIV